MGFFTIVGILLIIYYLAYLIAICFVDCDLALSLCQYFGKSLSKLNGKVVWITGASSGIGEAMAYVVSKNGGKVVLTARRQSELERVRAQCLSSNPNLSVKDVLVLPMDITNFESHQSAFDTVLNHFGQVDILINNAGRSQRAVWEEIDLSVDKQAFDLNVFAVISLSRILVKYFEKQGRGQIAVTSSLAGIFGVPFSSSYCGSKFALHGYFESLRTEKLGSKISATLLCPGPIFTNFLQESFTANPQEKFGEPTTANDRRMSAARCGELSMLAIVNKLDTAWIALFPVLPLVYAITYYPNVSRYMVKFVGARRLQRLRDTRVTVEP